VDFMHVNLLSPPLPAASLTSVITLRALLVIAAIFRELAESA
jgi:hypothetical protein